MYLLPGAAPAFLLAAVGRQLQESQEGAVGNGACLVFRGEASVRAGTLHPSLFLPGNSIPGYLLHVISFVLVSPKQPGCSNSRCSVVNSEIERVQRSSLSRSAALWGGQVLVILHMTPVLSKIWLAGAHTTLCRECMGYV